LIHMFAVRLSGGLATWCALVLVLVLVLLLLS
jgi:hypothetical protein